MKKIFGLFMLMLLACNVLAEDVIYPSVTASPLSRKGNKYYYNGEKISQRDCQAFFCSMLMKISIINSVRDVRCIAQVGDYSEQV